MDPADDHHRHRLARGLFRPLGTLILALLAAVAGAPVTDAAPAAQMVVAASPEETVPTMSAEATADRTAVRTARRRPMRVVAAGARLVRSLARLAVTSWVMPPRIVGGVPPGRSPPVLVPR